MHLILYVFFIVIMSYLIMYFVSDDKNKGDQSKTIFSFKVFLGVHLKWTDNLYELLTPQKSVL